MIKAVEIYEEYEEILLSILIRKDVIFRISEINDNYLTGNRFILFRQIKEEYYATGKVIGQQNLKDKLLEKYQEDLVATFIVLFEKIYSRETKVEDFEYVTSELKERYDWEKFSDTISRAIDIAKTDKDGSLKESREFIISNFMLDEEIKDGDYDLDDYLNYLDSYLNVHQSIRDNPELYAPIATGIPFLDFILNGGIRDTELGLLTSKTSGGKTTFLLSIAKAGLEKKKKVLFVAGEENKKEIFDRLTCSVTKISYDRFRKSDFTDQELKSIKEKMSNFFEGYSSNFYFIFMPENFTASSIFSMMKKLQLQGVDIDLLIVDYINVMQSSIKGKYSEEERLGKVAQELKNLAAKWLKLKVDTNQDRIRGIPIWTAAQYSKEGAKVVDPSAEDVGYSYKISQYANISIAIMTNKLKVTKQRGGKRDEIIDICPNFNLMTIHDTLADMFGIIDEGVKEEERMEKMFEKNKGFLI